MAKDADIPSTTPAPVLCHTNEGGGGFFAGKAVKIVGSDSRTWFPPSCTQLAAINAKRKVRGLAPIPPGVCLTQADFDIVDRGKAATP